MLEAILDIIGGILDAIICIDWPSFGKDKKKKDK
jgi:hypothetical protein